MIEAFLNTESVTKNLQNYIPTTAKIQFGRKFTLYVAMAIVVGIVASRIVKVAYSAIKKLFSSDNPKAIFDSLLKRDFTKAKQWAYNESWINGKNYLLDLGNHLLVNKKWPESFAMYNEIVQLELNINKPNNYHSEFLAHNICNCLIKDYPDNFYQKCRDLLNLPLDKAGDEKDLKFIEIALESFFQVWLKKEKENHRFTIQHLEEVYRQLTTLIPPSSSKSDSFLFLIYKEVLRLNNYHNRPFLNDLAKEMTYDFRNTERILMLPET